MIGFIPLGIAAFVLMKANAAQANDDDALAWFWYLFGTLLLVLSYELFA